MRVHTAPAEALGPLPAPHGLVHSCLQFKQQRDPLASLGTGAYILTHKYIHLKITKNERLKKKENKRSDTRLFARHMVHGCIFVLFFLFVRSKPDENHLLFEL